MFCGGGEEKGECVLETPRIGVNPGIESLLAVLKLLEEELGLVASPVVASKLQLRSGGTSAALIKMARSLSPAQLLGDDPFPEFLLCDLDKSEGLELAARAPAARRFLLHAALDVTGDMSVVLEASCVDAGVLAGGDLIALLRRDDGQVGLLDHRIRGSILQAQENYDIANANRALARAAKRAGYRAASYLYSSRVKATMRRGDLAADVLREASLQLRHGFTHNSYTLARGVATSGSSLAPQAQRIMGHAAFWNGNLRAARTAFAAQRQDIPLGVAESEVLETIDWLREDQCPPPKPANVALKLRPLVVAERDEGLLDDLTRTLDLWAAKEFEAFDTLTTQIALSAYLRTQKGINPWGPHQGKKLTPVLGALLRIADVGVCIQAGHWEQAAQVMESSVRMVPLTVLPGGIVAGTMSLLATSRGSSWSRLGDYFGGIGESEQTRPVGPAPGNGLIALINEYPSREGGTSVRRAEASSPWADAPKPLSDSSQLAALSRRQKDVYRLLLKGHTNAEIGILLGISERTVEAHLAHVYQKLGVHSRAALISRDLGNLRSST